MTTLVARLVRSCVRFIPCTTSAGKNAKVVTPRSGWLPKFRKLHFGRDKTNVGESEEKSGGGNRGRGGRGRGKTRARGCNINVVKQEAGESYNLRRGDEGGGGGGGGQVRRVILSRAATRPPLLPPSRTRHHYTSHHVRRPHRTTCCSYRLQRERFTGRGESAVIYEENAVTSDFIASLRAACVFLRLPWWRREGLSSGSFAKPEMNTVK